MELLHNCEIETLKLTDERFLEIRLRIESIIELCREGEISVQEAYPIISKENIYSLHHKDILLEETDRLEKINEQNEACPFDGEVGDTAYVSFTEENENGKIKYDIVIEGWEWDKDYRAVTMARYKKSSNNMEGLYKLTDEALKMFRELLVDKDYQQKRKEKIKSLIIQEGLILFEKNTDTVETPQKEKSNFFGSNVNDGTQYLFTFFKEFKDDYQLLIDNKYLEETKEGLQWNRTKVSLSEYFRSIKPKKMKCIPWTRIETIFNTDGLKAKPTKTSVDFEKWQKIKNTPAGK
jgi:hypothetical protein